MTCDICGSKKNVRQFYGFIRGKSYKECRKCFEICMSFQHLAQENVEAVWNRGKSKGDSDGR